MNSSDAALRQQLAKLRQASPAAGAQEPGSKRPAEWDALLEKALEPLKAPGARLAAAPERKERRERETARAVAAQPGPAALALLKPDSLGDLILFEPFLRILREAWPSTSIHILTTKAALAVSRMLPEGVAWIPVEGAQPFSAPTAESVTALREALRSVPSQAWLVSVCPRKTWWDAAAPALRAFDRRISLGPVPMPERMRQALLRSGLEASLPGYLEIVPVASELHELDKNVECASYLLGCAAPNTAPRLRLTLEGRQAARAALEGFGVEPGSYVACCPAGTANVAIKTWPAGRFADVLLALQKGKNLEILLIGSRAEEPQLADLAERIAAGGGRSHTWLGESTGDFEALCGLAAQASLYLGNDTGPMHAAAALGTPVVAVFGGGTWPRFTPRGTGAAVVRPMPCFGCDWQCHFGDAPCLKLVEPKTVLEAALAVLADGTAGMRIVEEAAHASEMIDALARGATQHVRNLKGQIEHLGKVSEEQALYLQALQAERTTLAQALELRASEADQRLATILEQDKYITSLEGERGRLDSRCAELSAQLEQDRRQLAIAQEAVAQQTACLKTLTEAKTAIEESLARRQAELEQAYATAREQTDYIASLKREVENNHAETEALRSTLEKTYEANREQAAYIASLERERTALQAEASAARSSRDEAAGRNDSLQKALVALQGHVSALESACAASGSEAEGLRVALEGAKREGLASQASLAEKRAELERAYATIAEQTAYISQLISERDAAVRHATERNREAEAARTAERDLRAALAERQETVARLDTAQRELADALEAARSVEQGLRAALAEKQKLAAHLARQWESAAAKAGIRA